mmetsp:Transcript_67702/g.189558  ORF Transcript_67702/g.189558 Transcript_67702/m.189558 type:complete len:259 (+) Transcript_67702:126-902(+)
MRPQPSRCHADGAARMGTLRVRRPAPATKARWRSRRPLEDDPGAGGTPRRAEASPGAQIRCSCWGGRRGRARPRVSGSQRPAAAEPSRLPTGEGSMKERRSECAAKRGEQVVATRPWPSTTAEHSYGRPLREHLGAGGISRQKRSAPPGVAWLQLVALKAARPHRRLRRRRCDNSVGAARRRTSGGRARRVARRCRAHLGRLRQAPGERKRFLAVIRCGCWGGRRSHARGAQKGAREVREPSGAGGQPTAKRLTPRSR